MYLLLQLDEAKYIIANNLPANDAHWDSDDPAWIGKASMSKRHRFSYSAEPALAVVQCTRFWWLAQHCLAFAFGYCSTQAVPQHTQHGVIWCAT